MPFHVYRLTALHQNVDEAIHAEIKRRAPDGLRLFRLRKLKQSIKMRLARLFSSSLQGA